MGKISDRVFRGCNFLWVTNAGAAEMTANSVVSLQRLLRSNAHSLSIGVLDNASATIISNLVDTEHVKFFDLSGEESWAAQNLDVRSDYVDWGTPEFRLICKAKYFAITNLLRQTGKPVIFADGDIAYLRNPVEYFERDTAISRNKILVQNDRSFQKCVNNIDAQYGPGRLSEGSEFCAGFTVWQPISAHLKIAEHIGKNVNVHVSDQPIFNELSYLKRRHVQLLRQDLFPNGSLTFGRVEYDRPDLDLQENYIVHANWRLGIDNKIQVLKEHGYWFL